MYKQYCKVKVTIATCVVLTDEETSEKALRIFLNRDGWVGAKSMALLNCLPKGQLSRRGRNPIFSCPLRLKHCGKAH